MCSFLHRVTIFSTSIMTRGTLLTTEERAQIEALHAENFSQRAIAKRINRSPKAVSKYLKEKETYGTHFNSSGNKKISDRQVRALIREASNSTSSASELRKDLELPIGTRRIQQILSSTDFLKYKKVRKAPLLSPIHVNNRLIWAREMHAWTPAQWGRIIFSDEKKFNLDGPDGIQYYWHDMRKEEKVLYSRQNGGGSLMVWGCFSALGRGELSFPTGKINAKKYTNILQEYLLPFANRMYGENFIFQQDNAPIHTAMVTKSWFDTHNIKVLDWPSRSPDLNPIENMWGVLARRVYHDCRQFRSVGDLKQCVITEWNNIDYKTCYNLSQSMKNRCASLLEAKGKKLNY